jgi:hypothetical protein
MNEDVFQRFQIATVVPESSPRSVVPSLDMNTDQILYWNAVALEADRVSHTIAQNDQSGPVLSARAGDRALGHV